MRSFRTHNSLEHFLPQRPALTRTLEPSTTGIVIPHPSAGICTSLSRQQNLNHRHKIVIPTEAQWRDLRFSASLSPPLVVTDF
jgi:hypothetical protein